MKRLSVEVPEDLHREFKKAVFSQGLTLQKVLKEMIHDFVVRNGQKPDSDTLKSSDTATSSVAISEEEKKTAQSNLASILQSGDTFAIKAVEALICFFDNEVKKRLQAQDPTR
jgi:hypothetical protein